MTNLFLELLAMGLSITTELLRLMGLDWSHSILLRHLKTIPWQRPKTLSDMPYDVVLVISNYLSVRDLCNLRETSKQLSSLVQDRSIWLLALRDILEVRPIPRLSFSLDERDLDEVMTATLRLTTLDRKIRGVDPITTFRIARSFDEDLLFPVPLPGGRYFVILQDSERKLVVHDWDADTLREGRPLVPPSAHPIYLWRAIPVSSTAINIAVASLEDSKDHVQSLQRTHISIYHCNADSGTSELIDYFSVDTKIWTLFIDTTHLAILWNHCDHGQFAYIRTYEQGTHTPIMSLKDPKCPQRGTITIISQGYFITAAGGGVYTRLFTMPAMHPINGTHIADSPVYHPCIWSAAQGGDYLLNPRITPLLLGHSLSSKTPPPKFAVWAGRHVTIYSLLDGADVRYDANSQHMCPDLPYYIGEDERSFMGEISGVHALSDRSLRLFALPVTHTTSFGLMRLGSAPSADADGFQVTKLNCPDMREHEIIFELSFDEESGRLFMIYEDEKNLKSRIVLAHL
ncbi:hypothetical protein PLEOSDRAFT_1109785 [Pleurotus ostreatus PC15]|uniref:F-box domain-containing protein n=2 Tax=Pleurotus TaxID=5320 RepID=A0A067N6U3_PLEO1|nr:hypothetical protein PLEOSDRAFT_1109785 [Pleurotus ostreatus PC15]